MPKLKNRPPKMGKMSDYAVVYHQNKKTVLGRWGSDEAKQAYARFITELQNDPLPNTVVPRPSPKIPESREGLVSELSALYLEHIKQQSGYSLYKTILTDFLLPLYADLPANSFSPKCLKAIRSNVVVSKRYCRDWVNKLIRQLIAMFSYGVEEELCNVQTVAALREVKTLRKGAPGTFDHPPRKAVPDEVVRQTLPFLTPTLQAMVQLQWLLGLRPSEVCKMKEGDFDRESDPDCWIYLLSKHKTDSHISGRKIYLSESARKLIAPYLEGKRPENFVFTPAQSEQERWQRLRTERKTPVQPSQMERTKRRAATSGKTFNESYDRDSYRKAILHAIRKGNKRLPSDRQIPHWTPYQIRHAAATFTEKTEGLDAAQSLLGHTSANMTKRYAHGQEAIQKRVALKQVNPFDTDLENSLIHRYK